MDTKQDTYNSVNKYLSNTLFYSQIIDSLQDYSIFTLDNDFIINSWSSGSEKKYLVTKLMKSSANISI
jgi:hypothetical protein